MAKDTADKGGRIGETRVVFRSAGKLSMWFRLRTLMGHNLVASIMATHLKPKILPWGPWSTGKDVIGSEKGLGIGRLSSSSIKKEYISIH